MKTDGKTFFKLIFVFVVTFLCFSCSFNFENTGKLQFSLPEEENLVQRQAVVANNVENTNYKVVLISRNGSVYYDKYHLPGSKVIVDNIPADRYRIIVAKDNIDTYFIGQSYFYVRPNCLNEVSIKLKEIKTGDIKIGFANGPKKPVDLEVTLYKNNGKTSEQITTETVKSNELYVFKDLIFGDYSIEVNGERNFGEGNGVAKFSAIKENIKVHPGRVLDFSGINLINKYDVALHFIDGPSDPLKAGSLTVKLYGDINKKDLLATKSNIRSDSVCTFEDLSEGKYYVDVVGSPYSAKNVRIDVFPDKVLSYNIKLLYSN